MQLPIKVNARAMVCLVPHACI